MPPPVIRACLAVWAERVSMMKPRSPSSSTDPSSISSSGQRLRLGPVSGCPLRSITCGEGAAGIACGASGWEARGRGGDGAGMWTHGAVPGVIVAEDGEAPALPEPGCPPQSLLAHGRRHDDSRRVRGADGEVLVHVTQPPLGGLGKMRRWEGGLPPPAPQPGVKDQSGHPLPPRRDEM